MQNLLDDLAELLQSEQSFISDGAILKNKVIEAALSLQSEFLELLMRSDSIREHFFKEIDGGGEARVFVFDKVKFRDFVSNKAFLPDSYTAFKNRIGLTDGRGNYLSQSRDVVLTWPYKDCVLEGGMTKEDRESERREIFWNTTLAPGDITRLFEPKVFTGWERWDREAVTKGTPKPVGQIRDDDNLLIKGNNLLALHSLKVRYAGKVKLIYIDPPYNTGNDGFRYNDRFNHSAWLTFMRNRLEVARDLLKKDGLIVVQISDAEQAYLKVLMDEVFNQNYRATIAVKMSHLSGVKMSHKERKILKTMEYLHVFSASNIPIRIRPQYVETSWDDAFNRYTSFIDKPKEDPDNISKWTAIPLQQAVHNAGVDEFDTEALKHFRMTHANRIFRTTVNRSKNYPKEPQDCFIDFHGVLIINGEEVELASKKIRKIDGVAVPTTVVGDIWTDIGINNVFNEGGNDIRLRFGKKPEMLLERVIKTFTDEGDIVLDFFAGTGTTAAVSHKFGRRWLAVEQLDYISTLTAPRLKRVVNGEPSGVSRSAKWEGGGSFVYAELATLNSTFADRIATAADFATLSDILADITATGYIRYNLDLAEFITGAFENLSLYDAKCILMDCLDTNHFYVNIDSLADADFDIADEDACATRSFYRVR